MRPWPGGCRNCWESNWDAGARKVLENLLVVALLQGATLRE